MLTSTAPNNRFTYSVWNGDAKKSKPLNGFTLIEMMAVLVIFGLLTAVALPNFERWYASTQDRVHASELAVRLQKLYARAALLGQTIELDNSSAAKPMADGAAALDMPGGWAIAEGQRLLVNGSGFCSPASITFVSAKQRVTLEITNQQCEVAIGSRGEIK